MPLSPALRKAFVMRCNTVLYPVKLHEESMDFIFTSIQWDRRSLKSILLKKEEDYCV